MMKRKVTACLLAGVLVLAVSAGAAFESVNGYAAYKNGVKNLLLQTKNVTLSGELTVSVDGQAMVTTKGDVELDGANVGTHTYTTTQDQRIHESHDVYLNGQNIWYNSNNAAEKTYYSNTYDRPEQDNLLGFQEDDELESRMVTFLELAADSVVGDLKNNFVSLGKEDGLSKYQVNISKQQVPALVNAGLSLMAYSQFSYSGQYVTYEDYEATFQAYYEKTTGAPISQELMDNYWNGYDDEWVEANQDLVEAFSVVQSDFSDQNHKALENKDGGVVYVSKDGSTAYYATQMEFYQAHPDQAGDDWDIISSMGKDLSLESVECTFALDDQGRLAENSLKATFAATDAAGKRHTVTIDAAMTACDYGSTQVTPLDVTGWKDLNED